MATENKINAKAILATVWNGLCGFGHVVVTVFVYLLIFTISLVFIYNPFFFFIYSLIRPRRAAASLIGFRDDFESMGNFFYDLNRPFIACLPWYAKKHFLMANKLFGCSVKQQVRLFNEATDKDKQKIADCIGDKAKNILWQHENLRNILVEKMTRLSEQQFQDLLFAGQFSEMGSYIQKNTLSDTMILLMLATMHELKNSNKDSDSEDYKKIFKLLSTTIAKNGLSARIISEIHHNKRYEFLQDEVTYQLQCFCQKQVIYMTQRSSNGTPEWKAFLAENELKDQVQQFMGLWQYDYFHKAGFELCEEAIIAFLQKKEVTMIERIFAYEPNNGLISAEINDIIAGDAKLSYLLCHYKGQKR